MPRNIDVGGVTCTFETWTALTASRTLVLNAHGMQDSGFVIGAGGVPIPARNYAFTVPWDRAVFNPFFKQSEDNLHKYAKTLMAGANQFGGGCVPNLAIYPFLFDNSWRAVFETFILRDIADVAHFSDIAQGTDSVMFADLLRANHWQGGTFANHYDTFLLLTCRSNLARGIGLGGAAPTSPNGLYRVSDAGAPFIAIA